MKLPKLGNKLSKILGSNIDDFSLELLYDDGFTGIVSLTHLFGHKPKGLVNEILKGGFFGRCFIESGYLAWPNGFELCPDALRIWINDQHKHRKHAA